MVVSIPPCHSSDHWSVSHHVTALTTGQHPTTSQLCDHQSVSHHVTALTTGQHPTMSQL